MNSMLQTYTDFKFTNRYLGATALIFAMLIPALAQARSYPLEYRVAFEPENDSARVTISIKKTRLVKEINFNLAKSKCHNFESKSTLTRTKKRLVWKPSGRTAVLEYRCPINHKRPSSKKQTSYDALMTKNWALFRGDDLVPPARVTTLKGVESNAKLIFDLPTHWKSINTEWERDLKAKPKKGRKNASVFYVDNPEQRFDRPTGWMIAGKVGTRRVKLEEGNTLTRVAVSAPYGSSLRRMEILTFMQFVWPEYRKAFETVPSKILIVGAVNPMWRGGLSAGNSFYMHADRPLISENGTSTLLHELVHMVTGIRGKKNSDWIAEGLAEFYSIELLRRAGGMNADRYQHTVNKLKSWSIDVKTLRVANSSGEVTAAATLLLQDLDEEIRSKTKNKKNLDSLVRELITIQKVDLNDLKNAFAKVCKGKSKVLESPLL